MVAESTRLAISQRSASQSTSATITRTSRKFGTNSAGRPNAACAKQSARRSAIIENIARNTSEVASLMKPILQADPRAGYLAHKTEIKAAVDRVFESGGYILGAEGTAFETEWS